MIVFGETRYHDHHQGRQDHPPGIGRDSPGRPVHAGSQAGEGDCVAAAGVIPEAEGGPNGGKNGQGNLPLQ